MASWWNDHSANAQLVDWLTHSAGDYVSSGWSAAGSQWNALLYPWGGDIARGLAGPASPFLQGGAFPALAGAIGDIFAPGGGTQPPKPPPGAGSLPGGFNPQDLINAYQAGQAGRGGAGGGGGAGGPGGYYSADGVFIQAGSPQDTYYRMADAIWTKVYGQHPPYAIVQTFHDLGVENTSQLDTIMKQLPSHIVGPDGRHMTIGQYDDLKQTAETYSNKYFGRPIPDQLIQDWVNQGIATPEGIQGWFLSHPATDIPQDKYGQIFDQAAQWTQKLYNDLPHPDQVHAIYQGLQP